MFSGIQNGVAGMQFFYQDENFCDGLGMEYKVQDTTFTNDETKGILMFFFRPIIH